MGPNNMELSMAFLECGTRETRKDLGREQNDPPMIYKLTLMTTQKTGWSWGRPEPWKTRSRSRDTWNKPGEQQGGLEVRKTHGEQIKGSVQEEFRRVDGHGDRLMRDRMQGWIAG